MPEIIDAVIAKTSPKRSFSMTEYKRFGLVFTKTRVYKFGHWSIIDRMGGVWTSHDHRPEEHTKASESAMQWQSWID